MGAYETKLPWYYMYAANLMSDQRYRMMTLEERGIFLTLQNECWVNDKLPSSPAKLSRLLGISEALVIRSMSDQVKSFFLITDSSISSTELDGYKSKHLKQREKQSLGGQKSAAKRKREGRTNSTSEVRSQHASSLNKVQSNSLNSTSVYKEEALPVNEDEWLDAYDEAPDSI
jgi:uncharacterized protein YdaU (DUF1376 family)